MKRLIALLVLLASAAIYAQPVPPGGLRKITHDATLTGAGTIASALGLAPCGAAGETWIWNGTAFACGTAGGSGVTDVDTLAPLQGGPITTTGTVSLSLCAAGEVLKTNVGATAWECAADAGVTGSGTSGKVPVFTGTNAIGSSSISDDLTTAVSTPEYVWSSHNDTSAGQLRMGADNNSTTATDTGWDVFTTAGDVYQDVKTGSSGHLLFRTGAGTENGFTRTWLDVTASTGAAKLTSGALDLNSHQIHNVTDGSSAQDAATVAQLTAATTGAGQITGTLTSGTVPIATGPNALGDSTLLYDGSVWTTTQGFGTSGILFAGTNTNRAVYIGAGGVASVNARYNSASTQTLFFNNRGFNGSTTQFRDLEIDNGKGDPAIRVTGSTLGTEFFGAVAVDTTLGVTGATTLSSTLDVTGTTNIGTSGSAGLGNTASGVTTINSPNITIATVSHISTKDGTSRPTIASCGTTPPTVVGTDISGHFTTASGITTSCAITFHTAYSSNQDCFAWTSDGTGTQALVPKLTVATGSLTFVGAGGAALATGLTVHWMCGDH